MTTDDDKELTGVEAIAFQIITRRVSQDRPHLANAILTEAMKEAPTQRTETSIPRAASRLPAQQQSWYASYRREYEQGLMLLERRG
jgi:hypothetical protein